MDDKRRDSMMNSCNGMIWIRRDTMTLTSTKVYPETLEIIRKIQGYRALHELEYEIIPELIHRLVQVELDRVSDGSEFSAATYQLSKVILDKTRDDKWVTEEEFKTRNQAFPPA